MFSLWLCYIIVVACNRMVAYSSILTPLSNEGGLRIFKDPSNEFEYVIKRHRVEMPEEPDSKERRSNMGSSFIRFGRSPSVDTLENSDVSAGNDNSKVDRQPRWKSPDIVIRFGRSNAKLRNEEDRLNNRFRSDDFYRLGMSGRNLPAYLDLTMICSELLTSDLDGTGGCKDCGNSYLSRLVRLCNVLRYVNGEYRSTIGGSSYPDDNVADPKRE